MRLQNITTWLKSLDSKYNFDFDSIAAASNDASFRRYFRISSNNITYIIMDAPPEFEDCTSFINVAELLAKTNVNVPKALEINLKQGFLLLSDLGCTTYLQVLNQDNADLLYKDASNALLKIQLQSKNNILPNYDEHKLMQEMELFNQWYISKHCNKSITDEQKNSLYDVYNILIKNNMAQKKVYVHRDYHCRNLMYMQDNNPGILDFQDALYGPITYDLVSLWRDAYIEWDEEQQIDWLVRYWQNAKQQGIQLGNFDDFYIDYEFMGLQRHLKVLGIFARLYHRDGKDGYLKDMPLVLKYTKSVASRYKCFNQLLKILNDIHETNTNVGYTF